MSAAAVAASAVAVTGSHFQSDSSLDEHAGGWGMDGIMGMSSAKGGYLAHNFVALTLWAQALYNQARLYSVIFEPGFRDLLTAQPMIRDRLNGSNEVSAALHVAYAMTVAARDQRRTNRHVGYHRIDRNSVHAYGNGHSNSNSNSYCDSNGYKNGYNNGYIDRGMHGPHMKGGGEESDGAFHATTVTGGQPGFTSALPSFSLAKLSSCFSKAIDASTSALRKCDRALQLHPLYLPAIRLRFQIILRLEELRIWQGDVRNSWVVNQRMLQYRQGREVIINLNARESDLYQVRQSNTRALKTCTCL